MFILRPVGDTKVCYHANKGQNDGSDPEEPAPGRELRGDSSKEDTREETNRGESAVKTENKVFSWPWSVLLCISCGSPLRN